MEETYKDDYDKPDFLKIAERFKFCLLANFIDQNFTELKERFSETNDPTLTTFFSGNEYTQKKMAKFIDVDQSIFSKSFIYKQWVFNVNKDIFKNLDSYKNFSRTNRTKWEELNKNTKPQKTYDGHIKNIEKKLSLIWNGSELKWDFDYKPWILSDIIDNKIPLNFSGTQWYVYKHTIDGLKRMTLMIDSKKDNNGFYTVTIKEKVNSLNEDFSVFTGKLFSDSRKKNTNRLIFLLKDMNNGKYAHILLFNQGDRDENEKIYTGHFTYYSDRKKADKYLTKFIILEIQGNHLELQPAFLHSDLECNDSEKIFFSFLSHREKSRLPSISKPPKNIKDFKRWIYEHRYEKLKDLVNYPREYELCYVKKTQKSKNSEITYKFYRDKLKFTFTEYSSNIIATFNHLKSENLVDIDERNETTIQSYKGEVKITNRYVYGLLFKEGLPLYLTVHIDGRYKGEDFFIGSITAEGDSDTVMVTYSCILIPLTTLADNSNRKLLPKVKEYLLNEAISGWGVVDPSNKRVRKKYLKELFSDN